MRQGPNWYTFIFISNILSRYIAQSSKSSPRRRTLRVVRRTQTATESSRGFSTQHQSCGSCTFACHSPSSAPASLI